MEGECSIITNKDNPNDPPIYALKLKSGEVLIINPGWKKNMATKTLLDICEDMDELIKGLNALGMIDNRKSDGL